MGKQKKRATQLVEVRRTLTKRYLKYYRVKVARMSARDFAHELKVGRTTLKSYEGATPISARFESRFWAYVDTHGAQLAASVVRVTSRHRLVDGVEIAGKPRRCWGCRRSVIFADVRQRVHKSKACRRLAERRRKRGEVLK